MTQSTGIPVEIMQHDERGEPLGMVRTGNSRFSPVEGLCLCDVSGAWIRDAAGRLVHDPRRLGPKRPPATSPERLGSRKIQGWSRRQDEAAESVTSKDGQR